MVVCRRHVKKPARELPHPLRPDPTTTTTAAAAGSRTATDVNLKAAALDGRGGVSEWWDESFVIKAKGRACWRRGGDDRTRSAHANERSAWLVGEGGLQEKCLHAH